MSSKVNSSKIPQPLKTLARWDPEIRKFLMNKANQMRSLAKDKKGLEIKISILVKNLDEIGDMVKTIFDKSDKSLTSILLLRHDSRKLFEKMWEVPPKT